MTGRISFCLILFILSKKFERGQCQSINRRPVPAPISVSIAPTKSATKCAGENQRVVCQIIDYDNQLPKMMRAEQQNKGYGGYVEYLLFKRTTTRTAAPGSNAGEIVVADLRVNYPDELLQPRELNLSNLTIFDKGDYNCTVMWHGIKGDSRWYSPSVSLNVYDCIHLDQQVIETRIGNTIIMQCIDVEAPVKWFKDEEKLDTDDGPTTTKSPVAPGTTPSRLKGIPSVRAMTIRSIDDAGVYSCKATFEDTQQIFTKNTEVRIRTSPTTPINIVPHRVSPTSVFLRWNQKPVQNRYVIADPTFYTVFYKVVESDTFLSKTVLKHPEVLLTNLKPSTVYIVRIQAENELGTSVSGSRIVVTPALGEIVSIDKRLLLLMHDHVKVLDQDLKSIATVLQGIVPDDEQGGTTPSTATTTTTGAASSRRPTGATSSQRPGNRNRRFFHLGRFDPHSTNALLRKQHGKLGARY